MKLSQTEADDLLKMGKYKVNNNHYDFPGVGAHLQIPLQSENKKETFLLDINRSRVKIVKGTYQSRAKKIIVLARLDFNGAPHRNPDDSEVDCPHIHLYREGYGDKWAFPLPEEFKNPDDRWELFKDFMDFINVVDLPEIEKGLFS